jgi:hypothetical protein
LLKPPSSAAFNIDTFGCFNATLAKHICGGYKTVSLSNLKICKRAIQTMHDEHDEKIQQMLNEMWNRIFARDYP